MKEQFNQPKRGTQETSGGGERKEETNVKGKGAIGKVQIPIAEKPCEHETEGTKPGEGQHPRFKAEWYKGSGKLKGKVALVTGGDSGIGRSVALLFAREGAQVAIAYHTSHNDARKTKKLVDKELGTEDSCLLLPGNLEERTHCQEVIRSVVEKFGRLDVLINNAGILCRPREEGGECSFENLHEEDIECVFRTNVFSLFYLVQEALPYLEKSKGNIINTASIVAHGGSDKFIDYTSSKAAIVGLTRALACKLACKGIRVNAVSPGYILTPMMRNYCNKMLMKRPGHPEEVAPTFVFLASQDSSYITGQIIHPNGGIIIGA